MPSMRIAMGTWVVIDATAESPAIKVEAIEAAFAAVSEVECWMHPQREGSDIARISGSESGLTLAIRRETWELLEVAKRISALSAGVFDPCLPSRPGRVTDIELTAPDAVVCRAPVALDLGGIAKGYAVDRAVEKLIAHECSAGIVNAGGDLRVFGTHRQKLLLRCPDGSFSPLEFADAALAVSDLNSEGRPSEHHGYYVRGKNVSPRFRHAAVLASEAATADALVKCVLLCPRETTNRVLRAFNATQVSPGAGASES
jgi:FAD:protein FMN transferase